MALFAHVTVGCISKLYVKRLSIFVCITAAFSSDLIAIVFNLVHIDDILRSHSFATSLILSILSGISIYMYTHELKLSLVIFITALSHWILDFITWPMSAIFPAAPGLPMFYGDTVYVGLGAYRSFPRIIAIELTSLVVCLPIVMKIMGLKNRIVDGKTKES